MIKDPKQIVTPFAFEVHPDLLGLPLATPKRRLAALLLDLLIASLLTSLGNILLATAVTAIFFWIAIRTQGSVWWKNLLRYGAATFASLFVFAMAIGILEAFSDSKKKAPKPNKEISEELEVNVDEIDWAVFGKKLATIDYSDEKSIETSMEELAQDFAIKNISKTKSEEHTLLYAPEGFPSQLINLATSIQEKDSLKVDSLKNSIVSVLAKNEFNTLNSKIDQLNDLNDDLKDENEELRDMVENPGVYQTVKRAFGMLGLSLGWIGIYFVMSIALFRGQTLGKRLLSIRVIRLNNNPIGLFFAFERFGGYAAGFATGLLGFFQIFWDPNRQAIHDKIAGTVVIDTRKKMIEKYEPLRKEILSEENLLD